MALRVHLICARHMSLVGLFTSVHPHAFVLLEAVALLAGASLVDPAAILVLAFGRAHGLAAADHGAAHVRLGHTLLRLCRCWHRRVLRLLWGRQRSWVHVLGLLWCRHGDRRHVLLWRWHRECVGGHIARANSAVACGCGACASSSVPGAVGTKALRIHTAFRCHANRGHIVKSVAIGTWARATKQSGLVRLIGFRNDHATMKRRCK